MTIHLSSKRLCAGLMVLLFMTIAAAIHAEDHIVVLPDGRKAILHGDFTWEYYDHKPNYDFDFSRLSPSTTPSFLRQGIQTNVPTQTIAVEMYLQGWRYSMPVPKSPQAAWGNPDRRTTWFYGYWYNIVNNQVSAKTPQERQNGIYGGDGQNLRNYWRNGGSPPFPTKLEWLLSQAGGVKPLQ